jgi:hypothetical protein
LAATRADVAACLRGERETNMSDAELVRAGQLLDQMIAFHTQVDQRLNSEYQLRPWSAALSVGASAGPSHANSGLAVGIEGIYQFQSPGDEQEAVHGMTLGARLATSPSRQLGVVTLGYEAISNLWEGGPAAGLGVYGGLGVQHLGSDPQVHGERSSVDQAFYGSVRGYFGRTLQVGVQADLVRAGDGNAAELSAALRYRFHR